MRSFVLFLVVALGCSPDAPFDRGPMMASIGDEVLLPQYELLVLRTRTLEGAASAFCEAPTEVTLAEVRAAFRRAKEPLKMAEPFAFGPFTESPRRLGTELDFWPGRPATVDERLAGGESVEASAIAGAGGYAKGFPALDHLLFAHELETLQPRRPCTYLKSLTSQIRSAAEDLLDAWAPTGEDYLGTFVRGDEPYDGVQHASSVLIEQLVFTLENVRELKLGKPFGKRDGGVVQPQALEAPGSGRSLADARDAVRGVEAVYRGGAGEASLGVRDWLLARRPALAPEIDAAFEVVYEALDAVPDALRAAILDHPTYVEAAYQAVRALQVLFAVDLAQALGVTVTFNPTDGD